MFDGLFELPNGAADTRLLPSLFTFLGISAVSSEVSCSIQTVR